MPNPNTKPGQFGGGAAKRASAKKVVRPDYAAARLRVMAFRDVRHQERQAARQQQKAAIDARVAELKTAAAAKGKTNA